MRGCRQKAQEVFHIVWGDLSASEKGVNLLPIKRPLGANEDGVLRCVLRMTAVQACWGRCAANPKQILLEASMARKLGPWYHHLTISGIRVLVHDALVVAYHIVCYLRMNSKLNSALVRGILVFLATAALFC